MKKNKIAPWLFLAPALLLYGIFFISPAVDSIRQSCLSWTGFTLDRTYVGFQNFNKLWSLKHFHQALLHNFIIFSVGGLFLFAAALTFAARLASRKLPRGAGFLRSALFFPSIISAVGVGLMWRQILDVKSGPINQLIHGLGGKPVEWLSGRFGLWSAILVLIWTTIGTYMIILIAGIQRISPSYTEAAEVDGAGPVYSFWFITLPLLKDVLVAALTLWFIGSLQVFGLLQSLMIDVEFHAPQLSVVSTYQYSIAFSTRDNVYEMGLGAAMAVVLATITLMGAWILNRFKAREGMNR